MLPVSLSAYCKVPINVSMAFPFAMMSLLLIRSPEGSFFSGKCDENPFRLLKESQG